MTAQGWLQIAFYAAVLTALTPLLGGYMARVYQGEPRALSRVFAPLERLTYRALRTDPEREQDWKGYARTTLVFSALFWIVLYAILRLQGGDLFNPIGFRAAPWDVTFNTTSSFVTNTNWQYYGGETTLSYLSQMAGLAVQNFVSAAVGMAVLAAVIRGFARRSTSLLGNFWVDLTRTLLYILIPLAFVGALLLVSQGVVQTLSGPVSFTTALGGNQTLALGPAASQIAIKQLGSNGGGFFNVNSAMPFENPTGLSNFIEVLFILLIPAALTATYGRMVGSRRQGWALYAAMLTMFVVGVATAYPAEQHGSPALREAGLTMDASHGSTGGNLQDHEQRFGIANSALWATATTDASNGSVNSGHESYTGIGGLVPLVNMATGEVIFGGVGSGLYGMLLFVLLTVFISGLMVGRTPEYLGKKIEAREIKLAMMGTIFVPIMVLGLVARRHCHQARDRLDLRQGPARILGDPVRLQLAGQQQRLRVRRLHRLGPAPCTGQRGRLRNHVRRRPRRARDALRPLRAAAGRTGGGRIAGRQARLARRPRDVPHRFSDLRRPADRRGRACRRADLPTRPRPRADYRGPHAAAVRMSALRKDITASLVAMAVCTLTLGLVYPLATTGVAKLLWPSKSDGSQVEHAARSSAHA